MHLQCCKYYHISSDFSSNFESSMAVFHHKLLTRDSAIGWTQPSSLTILFIRGVIQKVAIVTLNAMFSVASHGEAPSEIIKLHEWFIFHTSRSPYISRDILVHFHSNCVGNIPPMFSICKSSQSHQGFSSKQSFSKNPSIVFSYNILPLGPVKVNTGQMVHSHTTMNAIHINAIVCTDLVRWFTQPSQWGIQSGSMKQMHWNVSDAQKHQTIMSWHVRFVHTQQEKPEEWDTRMFYLPICLSFTNTESLNCTQPAKRLTGPLIDRDQYTRLSVMVNHDRSLACFMWPTLPCPRHSIWVLM